MQNASIDLAKDSVAKLFRVYLVPTLLGMLALCAVTATDGIFVGRGCGSDALAAVNICISPTMLMMGIGLMLGVGASVIASIRLSDRNVTAARRTITRALACGSLIVGLFLLVTLSFPATTALILGSSESLLPLTLEYMPWIFITCLFQIWGAIGLFVVRLDGSPKYAMWCNILPGIVNVLLDYLFIFPFGMGIRGAALATAISCFIGFMMILIYLTLLASDLRLIRIPLSAESLRLSLRDIACQCKIGISALLGEATMGILMITGNLVFMNHLGDNGVGAFSIACYYCPFAFMIGNAIAQSAQPIISYNYGLGALNRVASVERLALTSAVVTGLLVVTCFLLFPGFMVSLFLDGNSPAAGIAVRGIPVFSSAFIFFIFNLTAIGYFQSVKMIAPSIIFALLRGIIFLVPAFLLMPRLLGVTGICLSLFVSEFLCSLSIVIYYLVHRRHRKADSRSNDS